MEAKRGCPSLGLGGWVLGSISPLGVRDARWAKTHLWPAPSSLYYFQLLPAAAAVENCAGGGWPRRNSLEAWIGETPEGLAIEQLVILRNGEARACRYRYRPGMKKRKEKPTWSVWPVPGPPAKKT